MRILKLIQDKFVQPRKITFSRIVQDKLAQITHYHLIKGIPRFSIKRIKKMFGNKLLVGAEIGVYTGKHAKNILKILNMKKLYLIDPYEDYEDSVGYLEESKEKARHRLRGFENIEWVRKKSSDAVKNIPDDLDFVYIDGNHTYKFVKEDIENYYKKLRKGGVLCGHDIDTSSVLKALAEFITKEDLECFIDFQDWVVIKK